MTPDPAKAVAPLTKEDLREVTALANVLRHEFRDDGHFHECAARLMVAGVRLPAARAQPTAEALRAQLEKHYPVISWHYEQVSCACGAAFPEDGPTPEWSQTDGYLDHLRAALEGAKS